MSTRFLPTKSIKESQADLSLLKSYKLNLNLSDKQSNSPTPPHNPFSPESYACQSPETPQIKRQHSTSFRNALSIQAQNQNTIPLAINQSVINLHTKTANNPENINYHDTKEENIHENTDNNTPQTSRSESLSLECSTPPNNENDNISDKNILYENGYDIQRTICDTPQGTIYEAIIISDPNKSKVAIKKAHKILYSKGICIENNMNIITHENIMKEAAILHHLTVDNQPTADYIAKFINFFETQHSYFLVMEYCGDVTLKAFCDQAFTYVKQSKLNVKEYKRIMKYLFWQITVTTNWMNNDMHCCHLDMTLNNLIVQNGTFIEDNNGMITINQQIYLKVVDFGLSEIFKVKRRNSKKKNKIKEEKCNNEDEYVYKYQYDPYEVDWNNVDGNPFFCRKFGIKNHSQYCAPQIWMEEPYDARKSDSWDMGIILFKLITGSYPYVQADSEKDTGYWCIENANLKQYLEINNLLQYVSGSVLDLLNGLLNMEEDERLLSADVIHHPWFKSYYSKYKDRIEQKSIEQKQKRKEQKKKMKVFPYYNISGNANANTNLKHSSKSLI
eukprot:263968_1